MCIEYIFIGVARWERGLQSGRLTCDWDARVAKFLLDVEDVGDSMSRRQADWVGDEAIFKLFDFADHFCLQFC